MDRATRVARTSVQGPAHCSPARSALLWMGGVALVLSLGTTLHWRGVDPVHMPAPDAMADAVTRGLFNLVTRFSLNPSAYHWGYEKAGHMVLPLPAMLIYLYLPFSNAMRVWSRFGLFVMLAVSTLAGMGMARIARGENRRRARILMATIAAVVLVESAAVPFGFGRSRVAPQPATAWLARQEDGFAVAELPLTRAMNGPPLYAAYSHGKPITYGYGTFFPDDWLAQRPTLERFPEGQAIDVLRGWGVRYVLLAATNFGERWPEVHEGVERRTDMRLVGIMPEEELHTQDRWFLRTRGTALPFAADQIHVYELLPREQVGP